MKAALDHFYELMCEGASRVGSDYFLLPVADRDAVYRERVYCYELYHQVRCLWNDFPFTIGGEVDKAGNPHFANGPYANAEPDFLVHRPGRMDANLVVIEVKPARASVPAIRADLQKIAWFCSNAGYFRGVFLVFGYAGDVSVISKRVRRAGHGTDLSRIDCWYHSACGERPQRFALS